MLTQLFFAVLITRLSPKGLQNECILDICILITRRYHSCTCLTLDKYLIQHYFNDFKKTYVPVSSEMQFMRLKLNTGIKNVTNAIPSHFTLITNGIGDNDVYLIIYYSLKEKGKCLQGKVQHKKP